MKLFISETESETGGESSAKEKEVSEELITLTLRGQITLTLRGQRSNNP